MAVKSRSQAESWRIGKFVPIDYCTFDAIVLGNLANSERWTRGYLRRFMFLRIYVRRAELINQAGIYMLIELVVFTCFN